MAQPYLKATAVTILLLTLLQCCVRRAKQAGELVLYRETRRLFVDREYSF